MSEQAQGNPVSDNASTPSKASSQQNTGTPAEKRKAVEDELLEKSTRTIAERNAHPNYKAAKPGDRVRVKAPVKSVGDFDGTVEGKNPKTGQILVKPDTPILKLSPDISISVPPEYLTLEKTSGKGRKIVSKKK